MKGIWIRVFLSDWMEKIEKWIHWLLAIAVVVMVISGYGITEYRAVGTLSFGLLGKPLSFTIHNLVTIPFIVLFLLHLYFAVLKKRFFKSE